MAQKSKVYDLRLAGGKDDKAVFVLTNGKLEEVDWIDGREPFGLSIDVSDDGEGVAIGVWYDDGDRAAVLRIPTFQSRLSPKDISNLLFEFLSALKEKPERFNFKGEPVEVKAAIVEMDRLEKGDEVQGLLVRLLIPESVIYSVIVLVASLTAQYRLEKKRKREGQE